jgi:imidazolonepropionase-like amidohydrolase
MKKAIIFLAVLAILIYVSPISGQGEPKKNPPKITAPRASRLIDVRQGTVLEKPVILTEGERIKAVGPGLAVPQGAEVIDLGSAALLPGLIDCHTHLTLEPGSHYEDLFRKSPIDVADLLGWSDRMGAVAAGNYADIIAVAGDELRDITQPERVTFVMKGGHVIKR